MKLSLQTILSNMTSASHLLFMRIDIFRLACQILCFPSRSLSRAITKSFLSEKMKTFPLFMMALDQVHHLLTSFSLFFSFGDMERHHLLDVA